MTNQTTYSGAFYLNPWLSKSRMRRIADALVTKFIGKKYRDCAKELTAYAYEHESWQKNFIVYSNVNSKDEIELIEVREIE